MKGHSCGARWVHYDWSNIKSIITSLTETAAPYSAFHQQRCQPVDQQSGRCWPSNGKIVSLGHHFTRQNRRWNVSVIIKPVVFNWKSFRPWCRLDTVTFNQSKYLSVSSVEITKYLKTVVVMISIDAFSLISIILGSSSTPPLLLRHWLRLALTGM